MEPLVLYDSTRAENPAINLYEHDNKTCGSIQSHHAVQMIGTYEGMIHLEYSLDGSNWGPLVHWGRADSDFVKGSGIVGLEAAVYTFPAIPVYIRVNVSDATVTSLKVLLI